MYDDEGPDFDVFVVGGISEKLSSLHTLTDHFLFDRTLDVLVVSSLTIFCRSEVDLYETAFNWLLPNVIIATEGMRTCIWEYAEVFPFAGLWAMLTPENIIKKNIKVLRCFTFLFTAGNLKGYEMGI